MAPADNRFALASAQELAETTLAHAFGEGLLGEDELERRMEGLAHSNTLADVERLVHDLEVPEAARAEAALARVAAPTTALARAEDVESQRRMFTILSEQKKTGDWVPARRNEVIVAIGSSTLDLRNARLGPGETVINVRGVLSETVIIVPPGMAVTTDCTTVLAEVSQEERYTDAPPHPARIRVTGVLVLSELAIKVREDGETNRDARRRRRRERKALRQRNNQERRALRRGSRD